MPNYLSYGSIFRIEIDTMTRVDIGGLHEGMNVERVQNGKQKCNRKLVLLELWADQYGCD